MGAMSPRSTAPYHTLTSSASVTSPMTAAVEAMKAVGWIVAGHICRLLFLRGREEHLGPGIDWRAFLERGMPRYGPYEILDFPFVRRIVRRAQSPDIDGAAFGRNFDPHQRGTWRWFGVLRHSYERRVDRLWPIVEAGTISVIARPGYALRAGGPLGARRGNRRPDLGELGGELLNLTRPDHDCIRIEVVARGGDCECVRTRREARQCLSDRLLVYQHGGAARESNQAYPSAVN